jgi:hypothetical protein
MYQFYVPGAGLVLCGEQSSGGVRRFLIAVDVEPSSVSEFRPTVAAAINGIRFTDDGPRAN